MNKPMRFLPAAPAVFLPLVLTLAAPLSAPLAGAAEWEAEYWTGLGAAGGGYVKGLFGSKEIKEWFGTEMINAMGLGGGFSFNWFCFTERKCVGFFFGADMIFSDQKVYKADNAHIMLKFLSSGQFGAALRLPFNGKINDVHNFIFTGALDITRYILEGTKDDVQNESFRTFGFAVSVSAGYKFNFYDDIYFFMIGSSVQINIVTIPYYSAFRGLNMAAVKPYIMFGLNVYRFYKVEGGRGRGW